MGKASKIHKANKKTTLQNYEQSLNTFYSQLHKNKVDAQLRDAQAKDTYKLNMQIRDQRENAKLEAYEKSEETFVDQLIFNQKAEQEALEGEEKVFNERILANAFETDETNLAYQKQIIDSKFEYNSAQRGINAAVTNFKTTKALLSLGTDQQYKQAKAQQQSLKLRSQQARSDSNIQQNREQLKALQAEGVERARGRAGKSVTRSLQSIQAMSGVNSALIADQLLKSQRTIKNERNIIDAQLGKDGYIKKEGRLRRTQNLEQKKITVKNLKEQQKQTARSLGISTEQFNMTREQLGRSLLSAADSYEKRVASIKKDKFAADMAAYARRQLKPQVQPKIPAPYKTKEPVLIRPPRPVKPVKSKYSTAAGSTNNPVLQGISGVAGAVAAISPVFGPAAPLVAGIAGGIGIGSQVLDYIF